MNPYIHYLRRNLINLDHQINVFHPKKNPTHNKNVLSDLFTYSIIMGSSLNSTDTLELETETQSMKQTINPMSHWEMQL